VTDTGPGIDAKTMPRIFEPFFTTKGVGRGMGLAAIRGIVENHGGEIRVVSREGKGTVCAVLLPVSTAPAAAEPPSAEGQPTGAGRVLLADDEEDVRGVVHAMLETLGYEVIEARDGLEAVEIFRSRAAEIDLVILDLVMPRLTGEAALEQMRRFAPDESARSSTRGSAASCRNRSGGKTSGRRCASFSAFRKAPCRSDRSCSGSPTQRVAIRFSAIPLPSLYGSLIQYPEFHPIIPRRRRC
jgi:hypothetical protein